MDLHSKSMDWDLYDRGLHQEKVNKLLLENFNNSSNAINKFLEICDNILNIFAPCKKKFLRGNNIPACIYLLKVNYRNTRATREICSKLTIKELLVLVFLLLTLNMYLSAGMITSKNLVSAHKKRTCLRNMFFKK